MKDETISTWRYRTPISTHHFRNTSDKGIRRNPSVTFYCHCPLVDIVRQSVEWTIDSVLCLKVNATQKTSIFNLVWYPL